MASPLKSLTSDRSRYLRALKLFKERTTSYQSMNHFMHNQLPDILTRIVNGKSHLNIIGVGSGSGELDLKILSTLHLKFPQITVENEAIDPNPQQLIQYKGNSGVGKLVKTYGNQLSKSVVTVNYVSTKDIKRLLDSKGLSYQSYKLPSEVDVTECFTEGDENGELLLDLFTEVLHFSKTVSPELKAGIMELFYHPDYSVESNGKVMFNHNHDMIVVDQLT